MPAQEEEWTVVTAADKKRVMRQRGRRRRQPCTVQKAISEGDKLDAQTAFDKEALLCAFQECKEYLLRTDLLRHLTKSNNNTKTPFQELVCLGVGNFGSTSLTSFSAPLFQLALAVCLAETWNIDKVVYFDPVSTPEELSFVSEQFHFRIMEENCRGKYLSNHPTLFFLPHCPSRLYENVIWSNWGSDSHVLIGNSLQTLSDSRRTVDCPCLRAIGAYIEEVELVSTPNDCKEAPGNFLGAFNDTFVCRYKVEEWPERPYETLTNNDDVEIL